MYIDEFPLNVHGRWALRQARPGSNRLQANQTSRIHANTIEALQIHCNPFQCIEIICFLKYNAMLSWAELWLVNKIFLLYRLGQNPVAEKMLTLLEFGYFFQKSQNCRQIIGTPRRSIFHAPKSSQLQYTATIRKIIIFCITK